MAQISVDQTRRNLDAADLASARLSQGLAIINLLEQDALDAVEEGRGFVCSMKTVAESLWAARSLIEQAKEAMGAV